ncbi:MAG: CDGSH iron-sulfur domain-containing protein, partial [Candidatus Thioglobus sp.]|nr:CDGSH iron-sulfur domain-containing protein [Candidatus Thioglobus sp.]
FVPVKFEAEDTKTVYFCGCKHSSTKPFCDGSHSKL